MHVTLDGHHVPGSIFHVVILEAISLGGEGKIRVYYSTTNRSGTIQNHFTLFLLLYFIAFIPLSDKARSDVANLQKLLEVKEIHKRPDFEPWMCVVLLSSLLLFSLAFDLVYHIIFARQPPLMNVHSDLWMSWTNRIAKQFSKRPALATCQSVRLSPLAAISSYNRNMQSSSMISTWAIMIRVWNSKRRASSIFCSTTETTPRSEKENFV